MTRVAHCKFLKKFAQIDPPSSIFIRWVSTSQNMSVGGHFGFLASKMRPNHNFVVVTSQSLPTFALPRR